MPRENNAAITFNDANYMVSNEGFIKKHGQTIPTGNESMTKEVISNLLWIKNQPVVNYANNQLVTYEDLHPLKWVVITSTNSTNSAWALDRFRLYYPSYTEVAMVNIADLNLCSETEPYIMAQNGSMYYTGPETYLIQRQVFSVNDAFEHTFTFDLSGTDGEKIFLMTERSPGAEFQQIYCFPTGYSATRNKNAEVNGWFLGGTNPPATVGGAPTSLLFSDQPISLLDWKVNDDLSSDVTNAKIYAKTVWFNGTELEPEEIDKLIQWTDAGGTTNGHLRYDNIYDSNNTPHYPTSASSTSYQNLINKGWNINGFDPGTYAWSVLCTTASTRSDWKFVDINIGAYGTSHYDVYVGVVPAIGISLIHSSDKISVGNTIQQTQPFKVEGVAPTTFGSGTFSFDLSGFQPDGEGNTAYIVIKLPSPKSFGKVRANNYGGSYNDPSSTKLTGWDHRVGVMPNDVVFDGLNVVPLAWKYGYGIIPFKGYDVSYMGASTEVTEITIKQLALAGYSNCVFSYDATIRSSQIQTEYNLLISRGWSMFGPSPS